MIKIKPNKMKQSSNVELYENDNKIEQILRKAPKSGDLQGLNILESIE